MNLEQRKSRSTVILCFLLASILGTIFHFIFDWTNGNKLVGLFFPVNESIWEHLKLIFYPIIIVSFFEYYVLKNQYDNFICNKFLSILLGMALTVVLYYTYSGVYGANIDSINILIFYIAMGSAYYYSYKNPQTGCNCNLICLIAILFVAIVFVLFTNNPPTLGIFRDPSLSIYST